MTKYQVRQAITLAWAHPEVKDTPMNSALIDAITEEIGKIDTTLDLKTVSAFSLITELYRRVQTGRLDD